MLFSATYSDDVMSFAKKVIPDPIIIRLKKEDETLDNIRQYYTNCQNEEDKFLALSNIYGVVTIGQAMVFCHVRKKMTDKSFTYRVPTLEARQGLPFASGIVR